MMQLLKTLKASVVRSTMSWTGDAASTTRVPSFGTGLLQTDHSRPSWEWRLPAFVRDHLYVRDFWRDLKAEADFREQRAERESRDFNQWVDEKLDKQAEQRALADRFFGSINAGSITSEQLSLAPHNTRTVHYSDHNAPKVFDMRIGVGTEAHEQLELYNKAIRTYGTRPHLPGHRRELEVLKVQDVDEVFWDIASMIDAHRNHATALDDERQDVKVETVSPPIYTEVATYLFDPRHEMGPRQRSWHRQNRTQPVRTARAKRRGKR